MITKKYEIITENFDIQKSASCGQAFRWKNVDDKWQGISREKPVLVEQNGPNINITCCESDIDYWLNYLSIYDDYSEVEKVLGGLEDFPDIIKISSGIKVFKQDPFETLISFIISANNNVSRITKIISEMCNGLGRELLFVNKKVFGFPNPENIANSSEEVLKSFGSGYRAPYILKSARMIADGFSLESLRALDYQTAKKEIQKFPGVGAKVADCVLLFSLGFEEAYPMDVWMKRVSMQMYPKLSEKDAVQEARNDFKDKSGIAQQYLFHYAREVGLGKKDLKKI